MRLAITTAQTVSGKWETIADPDVDIQKQKVAFKAMPKDGKVGSKVYKKAVLLTSGGEVKKKHFRVKAEKPAPKKAKSDDK